MPRVLRVVPPAGPVDPIQPVGPIVQTGIPAFFPVVIQPVQSPGVGLVGGVVGAPSVQPPLTGVPPSMPWMY